MSTFQQVFNNSDRGPIIEPSRFSLSSSTVQFDLRLLHRIIYVAIYLMFGNSNNVMQGNYLEPCNELAIHKKLHDWQVQLCKEL